MTQNDRVTSRTFATWVAVADERSTGRPRAQNSYSCFSSGSFSASIFARFTMTRHCFHVASSCILPSSMRTPRPSGSLEDALRELHLLRRRAEDLLRDRHLARMQRPRADAAEEERGAELVLAAERVGDVAERAVERE